MKKIYLTAAVLTAALGASPAFAQTSESDTGGAMGSYDSTLDQESQVPEDQSADPSLDTQETQLPATGATGDPAETQIPADQSGSSDAQLPADQSGQAGDMMETEDQGGIPSETQLPADQRGQSMEQQDPASGEQAQPSDTLEAVVPAQTGEAGALNEAEIMQVQDALNQQGFDPGPTDGLMGPQTSSALREFQQAQGLEASGKADQQTLAALGVSGAAQQPQQQQQDQPQDQQQPLEPQQQDQQLEQAPSQP